jgi:ParB/RepB/Spo0J family partition protein
MATSIIEVEVKKLYLGKTNVRRDVGDISELVSSIKEKGVLHPIVVRPVGKRFEVIVGSRRFTAAKRLGVRKVPALLRPVSDSEALVESLIENVQRGDLELMDEGEAYEVLKKRLGGTREIERQTGISSARITETLDALDAARKLGKAGIKVTTRLSSNSEERASRNALPKQHAVELERTFKGEAIQRLPARERESKYIQLAKAIAPLPGEEARKILNEFKMYPEKDVAEVEAKAISKLSGVALETYIPPKLAKELDEIAQKRNASIEDVLPEVLQRGLAGAEILEASEKSDDAIVTEIDTGYVFSCPVCKGKYRILHNKPTDVHRFEQLN